MYNKHRTNTEIAPGTPKEPHKGSTDRQSTLIITNWKQEKRLEQWGQPGEQAQELD